MGYIFESTLYDLLVIAATLIILAYFRIKHKLSYFSDREMPYIKPSIIETIKFFTFRKNAKDGITEMYEKYKGDAYTGFFQIFTPSYFICDPELVQKILIKDFSYFHDHGISVDEKTNPLDGHLFNMNGDKWRILRYKLAPTFTSGKLKCMLPMMEESTERLMDTMKTERERREDVSVKDIFREYSIDVIASCAFGIDGAGIKDPDCEFRRIIGRIFKPTVSDMFLAILRFVAPSLINTFKIKLMPREIEDFFFSLTKQTFELRKTTGEKRNDFIQLLLELKEKGSVKIDFKDLEDDEKEQIQKRSEQHNLSDDHEILELTDELLCAQIFVFFVAGFENSSHVIAWATYLLSKNKDIQERVRKEVKEMKEKHGGFDYVALKNMKLLEACISGKKIEKGINLIIPIDAIHQDAKYWNNPKEFNPDRFLEGHVTPGTYLPFGDGPRICIAQRFALLQTKMMLAKLIDNFEISPSNKTQEPITFERMVVNNVVGGLWGNFKPLENI